MGGYCIVPAIFAKKPFLKYYAGYSGVCVHAHAQAHVLTVHTCGNVYEQETKDKELLRGNERTLRIFGHFTKIILMC